MRNTQFIRFLLVGGLSALVNIVARVILGNWLSYEFAVVMAYLVAMTWAFALSRIYVFAASGRSVKAEYMRFAIVNVVAIVQVWLISVGLALYVFPAVGFQFYPELVAHVIGVLSPVFTSYYGHKVFTFRSSR